METQNPYAAPADKASARGDRGYVSEYRRKVYAWLGLPGSIALALVWAGVNQFVLDRPLGPVPMFVATTSIALMSAILTKDLVLAPLTSGLAILAACVLVGSLRGWSFVHVDNFVLISMGCSLPPWLLAVVLRSQKRS